MEPRLPKQGKFWPNLGPKLWPKTSYNADNNNNDNNKRGKMMIIIIVFHLYPFLIKFFEKKSQPSIHRLLKRKNKFTCWMAAVVCLLVTFTEREREAGIERVCVWERERDEWMSEWQVSRIPFGSFWLRCEIFQTTVRAATVLDDPNWFQNRFSTGFGLPFDTF